MTNSAGPDLRSFIIYHRDFPVPPNRPTHTLIAKGDYRPPAGIDHVRDDAGKQIAQKGMRWSEVTAMYWVWKNAERSRYVSFPHYRRHFWAVAGNRFAVEDKFFVEPNSENLANLTSATNVDAMVNAMRVADAVVPVPARFALSLRDQYCRHHAAENWEVFVAHLAELGSEFRDALPWLNVCRFMHLYHMFVLRWEDFDEYMSMLTQLLERMDPDIVCPSEGYQARVPAYLTERFFNFYLHVKRMRTICVPVCLLEKDAF